ncbi:Molybdenum ABC transporter permease [Flavobacterium branchiophilum]|uniref:Molybdenum ABC transporter permease n=1 Tax=Flavobacterium branchiophilum (strain FL-15) TaxID=1034807 RepID=G2Z3R1_FLABF|nr:hypothetical protein [Flavobacterium branchiophilum]CCB70522.1 Hypothetical protein FBFL15_2524 [Flavobacterium branchiophilum FL-15]
MFTYLAYIISFIVSIIGGFIAWKSYNYFIPKSDFYRKSSYQIFYKKIFWVLSVMMTVALLTLALFGHFKGKI